jgi:hypothetical protein
MATITLNEEQLVEVGSNIKAVQQGNLLILVIDVREELGPSSTGKMTGVGSTGGFTRFPANLSGNVYIGRKR